MQSLPQKRRTLSTGLSQYQHDPFGGRLTRDGLACTLAAGIASDAAPLSLTLSCIVSKVYPLPATHQVVKQYYFSEISQA